MKNIVTFKGMPITLVGKTLQLYQIAPHFTSVTKDFEEIDPLVRYQNKIKILTSFVSLDTPICDLQVKEFNEQASKLSKDVVVLAISKDLPFAQTRFCESFSIQNILLFSDYKKSSFGIHYGLLIQELNLLARSVIILDQNDSVRYFEIVPEITHAPNYQKAMSAVANVLKNPKQPIEKRTEKCIFCEGKILPLKKEEIENFLKELRSWSVSEKKELFKEIKFNSYHEAKFFLDLCVFLAEEKNHHPTLILGDHRLKIVLSTHAAGGLTKNDFIFAKNVDELYENF